MSWIPTMRIARAAWRGRTDPAGLIKTQLKNELSPREPEAAATRQSVLGLAPVTAAAVERAPLPPRAEDQTATHNHLLLLLR